MHELRNDLIEGLVQRYDRKMIVSHMLIGLILNDTAESKFSGHGTHPEDPPEHLSPSAG
jgi:hypothetical protein